MSTSEDRRGWRARNDSSSTSDERRRSSAVAAAIRKRFSSRSMSGRRRLKQIVFLGACEVGKTAIVSRLKADYFPNTYEPTWEDFISYSMPLKFGGEPEQVELVDVTGATDRECHSVQEKAIMRADAYVVVFSANSRSSFVRAEEILQHIVSVVDGQSAEDGFRVVLVANQVDEDAQELDDQGIMPAVRVVSDSDGFQLAEKFGIKNYLEMSALNGIGVDSIPRRLTTLFDQHERKRKQVSGSTSFARKLKGLLKRSPSAGDDVQPRAPVLANPYGTLPRRTKTTGRSTPSVQEQKPAPLMREDDLCALGETDRVVRTLPPRTEPLGTQRQQRGRSRSFKFVAALRESVRRGRNKRKRPEADSREDRHGRKELASGPHRGRRVSSVVTTV